MKCPHCNETLLMTERHNIEIDYCPQCRGIWLDKGELDKMLDYVEEKYKGTQPNQQSPQQSHQPNEQYYQQKWYDDDHKHHHDHYKHQQPYHKHKKKGFLGDLFDFD